MLGSDVTAVTAMFGSVVEGVTDAVTFADVSCFAPVGFEQTRLGIGGDRVSIRAKGVTGQSKKASV